MTKPGMPMQDSGYATCREATIRTLRPAGRAVHTEAVGGVGHLA
jgi:hypothetical protein